MTSIVATEWDTKILGTDTSLRLDGGGGFAPASTVSEKQLLQFILKDTLKTCLHI